MACFLLLVSVVSMALHPPIVQAQQRPWFVAQRVLDLTGDTRPDTITVRADGSSSDNLLVTLTLRVDGVEGWREQWRSRHMLVDAPEFQNGEVGRAAYVRNGLLAALKNVSVQRFDSANYVLMARPVDSTVLRHPPRFQVLLVYGHETKVVLVWDAQTRAFRRLWACC
jgi:hypothetical protein